MLLQVLKLCDEILKCFLVDDLFYSTSIGFYMVCDDSQVQDIIAISNSTTQTVKDATCPNLSKICISAFSLRPDLNDIASYSRLNLPHWTIFYICSYKWSRGCIVLLVLPLHYCTSGPVMHDMSVRAECLTCLSVLSLSLLQWCSAMRGLSLTEIRIIK